MLSRLAAALAVMSAIAFPASPALADGPTYLCVLAAAQQDAVTGSSFQGVLVGVVAHADPSAVSIRCYITVNGVPQSGADTGTGTGTAVATAQKDISFFAGDTDVLRLCYVYTSAHGNGSGCRTIGIVQVPPQVVYDLVEGALEQVWPIVDPPLCSVLKTMAGDHAGLVRINSQGDVYVQGRPYYDCPPYDITAPTPDEEALDLIGPANVAYGWVGSV